MKSIYNINLYQSETLRQLVDKLAKKIPPDTKSLLTMGRSGCALGTALLLTSPVPLKHYCFRKEGERAHSSLPCTGEQSHSPIPATPAIIVDDIIDSGATAQAIITKAAELGVKPTLILVAQQYGCYNGVDGIPVIALENYEDYIRTLG